MGRTPTLSIVAAHRDQGDGYRDRLWEYVRQRFERDLPDAEIVVGTDDGVDPFHKTLALNRAVAASSGDTLLVTDTDTWLPRSQVDAALSVDGWCQPYSLKVKLAAEETSRALADPDWTFTYNARGRYERKTGFRGAPPLIVPRSMWDAVGGMDERMRGWGSEDRVLYLALRAMFGKPPGITGFAWHLWHKRIGVSGADLWVGQDSSRENQRIEFEYRAARSPEAMRHLIETR